MAVVLGRWSWAFTTFRIADGATTVLIPLAALLRYDLSVAGAAGVVAVLNLGSVPATLAWCRIMERHPARRRITLLGLTVAAAAFATLTLPLPLWGYLLAAVTAVAFGIATAPAAGILVLEGRPRSEWATATGILSRRGAVAYLSGQGTLLVLGVADLLEPRMVFGGAAVVALAAAFLAARTIVPRAQMDAPTPAPHQVADPIVRAARRFERVFFSPSRLRFRPRLRLPRGAGARVLFGAFLTTAGAMTFFSGYQGTMVNALGLSAGLVIMVEAGSHVANALAFTWAGGLGARSGEARAIRIGLALRLTGLAVLIATVAIGGPWVVVVLMGAGLILGTSFALLHVNIPVYVAGLQPARGASAVGAYHTAVSLGVLTGALLGFGSNLVLPLLWAHLLAWTILAVGAAVVLKATHDDQQEASAA